MTDVPSIINGDVYPVTITRARYGGTYSGAQWHAWAEHPSSVPSAAYGSDTTCAEFWGFSLVPDEGADVWDDDNGGPSLLDYMGSMNAVYSPSESDEYWVGKGKSPQDAYDDLKASVVAARSEQTA